MRIADDDDDDDDSVETHRELSRTKSVVRLLIIIISIARHEES